MDPARSTPSVQDILVPQRTQINDSLKRTNTLTSFAALTFARAAATSACSYRVVIITSTVLMYTIL